MSLVDGRGCGCHEEVTRTGARRSVGLGGPWPLGDAPPDPPDGAHLVVHGGRRGRIAVLRLSGDVDRLTACRWALEQATEHRARWLVLDLGDEVSWTGQALDTWMLVHRLAPDGVGLAVAGDHRPESRVARLDVPVFPTVPIALGTLGAVNPDAVSRAGGGRRAGTGSGVGEGSPSRAVAPSR